MTSHHDIYTTTDVKPEMIPGIQTGNGIPPDKCNLCGIAHARKNKKEKIFMQRRLGQIYTFILEWWQVIVKNQNRTRPELTQPELCLFIGGDR